MEKIDPRKREKIGDINKNCTKGGGKTEKSVILLKMKQMAVVKAEKSLI
jgi:hypothetical protein